MKKTEFIKVKKENSAQNFSKKLYKGACIKIKNSQKTFQVIGINPENKICWVREWPFENQTKKTFALQINQIVMQIFCSNHFSD